MKVLVAFEFSGVVRRAFRNRGHDCISCDLRPSLDSSPYHIIGDVRPLLQLDTFDLIIAHPPCTALASSGARWFEAKRKNGEQAAGIDLFMNAINANCKKICVENPVGIMSSLYRKPDQICQPWQFGHGEQKAICLWLKGLPPLQSTKYVYGRRQRVHTMAPCADRGFLRSIFYDGIAAAMAEQWGEK